MPAIEGASRRAGPARGFSLIELMIVLIVAAILAVIAYPSYREYVMRGRRVEARTLLHQAAVREEQWRAQNGRYMTASRAEDIARLKLPNGGRSARGYYALEIASVDGDGGYTLTARRAPPLGLDERCGDLVLDATGRKSIAPGTPGTVAQCWR